MRIRKSVGIGVCAVALVAGTTVPALATVVAAGGGTWSYGTTGGGTEVYSNYYHGSRNHRSSVINYWGEYYSSGCKSPGVWSYASERADPTAGHTDNAYWSNSC